MQVSQPNCRYAKVLDQLSDALVATSFDLLEPLATPLYIGQLAIAEYEGLLHRVEVCYESAPPGGRPTVYFIDSGDSRNVKELRSPTEYLFGIAVVPFRCKLIAGGRDYPLFRDILFEVICRDPVLPTVKLIEIKVAEGNANSSGDSIQDDMDQFYLVDYVPDSVISDEINEDMKIDEASVNTRKMQTCYERVFIKGFYDCCYD